MRTTSRSLRAAALCAAALLAACSNGDAGAPPAAPLPSSAAQVAPLTDRRPRVAVRRGDIHETETAIGSFSARRRSRLGPQVSGRVDQIEVDVGDVVRAGQDLARLDQTPFQIEVQQARAALATAEASAAALDPGIGAAEAEVRAAAAELKDAEANLERMRTLWESPSSGAPSIPKSRYDDALFRVEQVSASLDAAKARATQVKAQVQAARAKVAEEQQRLRHFEQRLSETVVRAPYDGVVTQRLVDPGEPVTSVPVTHLLEVQDTGTLELVFSLPQVLLATTRIGTPVTFEVAGVEGGPWTAAVEMVFPEVDEATRSFRCRALVDNRDGRLRPGLLAQVRTEASTAKGALIVPAGALQRVARGWQILVDTGGREETRTVEVGLLTDAEAEVRSGLAEGDRVILVSGALR